MTGPEPRDSGHMLRFEEVVVRGDDGARLVGPLDLELPLWGVSTIVGPSGSGKTTLLRLCNRLEVPTSGRILLDGVDQATVDVLVLRRRIGMVFQRPALFGGTVRDNLHVARADAGDRACEEVLASAGIDPSFLDRRADELSGGEAQRVCLARALLTEPEVLLMDEPTSALDPDARRAVEAFARAQADGGRAVVWVTHDLDQARRLADRTVVLVDGRVAGPREAAAFLGQAGEVQP